MKKTLSIVLALSLMAGSSLANGALALNYRATLGNEATFETYTEARENAPASMQEFLSRGKYAPHAAMADYPGDTTYIYRSPDMFGINAAVRMNTNIAVFTDKHFDTKEEARAYLADLGLLDIADGARGSVILVTPSNPEAGFTAEDQKNYYKLQTAMFAINAAGTENGEAVTYVDASYYGGFGFYYVVGIDGGATFLNNYVAGTLDYVSRIAGMLLVNGKMENISQVAAPVPVYLVNADSGTIAKYCEANKVDAVERSAEGTRWYDREHPARRVVSASAGELDRDLMENVYYNFMIKAVRGQEMKVGQHSASTPYQGYGNDQAPYSLSVRNALVNGVTADGIHEITTVSDALSEYKNNAGEYVETWYEYLPEEVLNNTAPAGSIPLLLSIHGGGDDPRQYVDGQGWLVVAGRERLAIVAPDYSSMNNFSDDGRAALLKAFPALVHYMLDKYPALDASRVYVNGYSMGSLGTCQAMYGDPRLFAAAFPQAGVMNAAPREEDMAKFADVDLPICMSTSEYDLAPNVDPVTHNIVPSFYSLIRDFLKMNEMKELPEEPDFDKYPMTGFDADITGSYVMNDEYTNHYWRFLNDKGVPMVGFHYIDSIVHCLYPEYANMVWDFLHHYSRNLETGEVIYHP